MSGSSPFGGVPWMGIPGTGPGLDALEGVYRAFVESFQSAAGAVAADGGKRAFEAFGARFFGGPFAAAPAPTEAATLPALGPTREHQLRAERLRVAVVRLAAAQQEQATMLAASGALAGAEFLQAAAARDLGRDGLRATFDRWIEHAESTWQRLAHSAEWCEAQARTFDAALDVRAAQQAIADDAARLAGLPTLRDVDAVHRRLREVERTLHVDANVKRASSAPRPARARPAARKSTAKPATAKPGRAKKRAQRRKPRP